MDILEELEETNRLLRKEQRDRIPLADLIAEGRTEDIIARNAQKEAKAAIMAEKDYAKRQRLIAMHLPIFGVERRNRR